MTTSVSYDFSGAVVLVTGGGSGIGAATARACAAAGATAIAVDVDPVRLAEVAASGVIARQVDVADAQAVRALVAEVVRDHGRIDAAVLAAAIQMRTHVEAISDAEWRRHMAVNLDGVFHCIREIAPVMKRQRKGAILTFGSGLVNLGWPGASAYAASKGALIGLTKCVAQELRPFGVRAGRNIANQLSDTNPGISESIVGRPGKNSEGFGVVTASARILEARIWGDASTASANCMSTSPPITATSDRPPPL
jgi:3-oxoacyl-[acyl-carrier protein] reductase